MSWSRGSRRRSFAAKVLSGPLFIRTSAKTHRLPNRQILPLSYQFPSSPEISTPHSTVQNVAQDHLRDSTRREYPLHFSARKASQMALMLILSTWHSSARIGQSNKTPGSTTRTSLLLQAYHPIQHSQAMAPFKHKNLQRDS